MRSARRQTIFWLLLLGAAILTAGALNARQTFRLRGIPTTLPGPINAGGARLGINVALEQYDDAALDETLSLIQAAGFTTLKQAFYYQEPFDWASSDRLITAVSQHQLTLVPLLDGSPHNDFAPVEAAVFAAWAGEFARRYQEQLRGYIIWDEPNLAAHWGQQPVNANEYAAILTAAAHAIRAADGDALIITAPLAPTKETGPQNLSDILYLQSLYETGAADAFDVVAAKPYGFDTGPDDRAVDAQTLNFSRVILLREEMIRQGERHKAIWAGNWGWNSLPHQWQGQPSIWGQTDPTQQLEWTLAGLHRARQEWPWMGLMFVENWQPHAPADDPRWGFSLAQHPTLSHIQATWPDPGVAYPGFHLAQPTDSAQVYQGGWEFSPEYGADISETPQGAPGDQVTFTFWGTDVGLRVRRANFRARLYVTVDGRSANALPHDEKGSMLILTAADPTEDTITIEPVAHNLPPGQHTVHIEAARGWDQWALNGFSVGYVPPRAGYRWTIGGLLILAVVSLLMAVRSGRRAEWGRLHDVWQARYHQWQAWQQILLTAAAAALVAVTGWLTWGAEAAGLYRRLGDVSQLALTAAAAAIFYVTPNFLIYSLALAALLVLIYFRPAWGVVLIAFCISFYVRSVTKPIFSYRFSPVEIFTLVTTAAYVLAWLTHRRTATTPTPHRWHTADYAVLAFTLVATLSLFFTERLDVATNEWRVLIIEPALFYWLLRRVKLTRQEMWAVWDAFVLGGLVVAFYGLWQYTFDQESLITAEGGLLRLRSFYGSPNNVALFLGRILPLLVAVAWLGQPLSQKRRWFYACAILPIGLAVLLTFSRGGLLLGVPAALLFIFWRWQVQAGRRTWPWVVGIGLLGLLGLITVQQVPALAGRFNLQGATGVFRLHLWRASINMVADHPWFGVGLDNFLYAHRGRYIFEAAWQEPDLSHPHNIVFDFATRLGLLGVVTGGWMFVQLARLLKQRLQQTTAVWFPLVVGLGGILADILAHGLVDHSFFLVDLAFTFYLVLAAAVWLQEQSETTA